MIGRGVLRNSPRMLRLTRTLAATELNALGEALGDARPIAAALNSRIPRKLDV